MIARDKIIKSMTRLYPTNEVEGAEVTIGKSKSTMKMPEEMPATKHERSSSDFFDFISKKRGRQFPLKRRADLAYRTQGRLHKSGAIEIMQEHKLPVTKFSRQPARVVS